MKIKKIRGKNFREALALVKKELGEDAVILSSEDRNGERSYVEVTAAIDYDSDVITEGDYAGFSEKPPADTNEFIELKNEIKHLKQSIETMRNTGLEIKLPEEMKKVFYFLKEKSIKEEYALKLAERADGIEKIGELIAEDINTPVPGDKDADCSVTGAGTDGQKIIMLMGPTGVGKTTTVAKLASQAVRERKKAAMLSIDTYKIGATEQIRIYSRMIGIPLDIVSSVEGLKKSIERFSDKDLILIDTAGKNPGDSEYIKELSEVCGSGLPIETQLLLSTTSDCDFLMDTHRHYRALPVDRIAFTKTDEAVRLGSIYNLCRLYKKPVAYITNGQRVPGNIEFYDSRKLTNLILRTGSA